MEKKEELWAAISQLFVSQEGMLDSKTWPAEHKRLLSDCLNGVGCELSHVREEVRRHLTTIGFSDQQATYVRERVVRQMLGRPPEVPAPSGYVSVL